MRIQYLLIGVGYEKQRPELKGVFEPEENLEDAVFEFLKRQYGVDGEITTASVKTPVGTRTYYQHTEGPVVDCGYHALLDPVPINTLFDDEKWIEEEQGEEE